MSYSRYPRDYEGPQTTNRQLRTLLQSELQEINKRRALNPQEILGLWPVVVGPQIAPFARAEKFQEGLLYVTVANSIVYSLLAGREKSSLLRQLKKELPASEILNIIFSLG